MGTARGAGELIVLAELVFVTRLLGLMSGERTIDAKVDPAVHSVELVLDGRPVQTLRSAPWRSTIDFGPELAPHELTAVGRDAEGRELARDTQFINVPRPQAEIGVMLGRDRAEITWQHIGGAMPSKMQVKLGSKVLASTITRTVRLPELSPDALNVMSIDLEFEDGSTARRDVVFGGFAEEVPAELTLRSSGSAQVQRIVRIACARGIGPWRPARSKRARSLSSSCVPARRRGTSSAAAI